jgi:hypothetical protein
MCQQHMAARARLPPGKPQARPRQIRDARQRCGIARWQNQTLFAPGPGHANKAAPGQKLPRRRFIETTAIGVEHMARGDQSLPGGKRHQPIQAATAAQGQPAAGLPCRPIQQRVMAAGPDRRRVEPLRGAGIGLGGEPAFQLPARKKPFAAKLRRRELLRPRKLIERAFRQAEEARRFLQGQHIRHLLAKFGKNRQSVKPSM